MQKLFISAIDFVSSILLDNPYLFNFIRYLLAGKQKRMKMFIKKGLKKYECLSVGDICCGTGDFAQVIPDKATYVGWDFNQDFIDFATKRYLDDSNKKFIKANILDSKKLFTQKYDAIILISTIHHFSDRDLEIILHNVSKMVNKVVIFADIIPDAPHFIQRFFAKIDRGKYVRPADEKLKIIRKYFKVVYTEDIPTRSAVQFGIICEKLK
jgi:SAM-dependent methyltransferase